MSGKRKRSVPPPGAPADFKFLDFSSIQNKPRIVLEAGEIASNLIGNDDFFNGTVVEVLKQIAAAGQLSCPTADEVRSVKLQLKCRVSALQIDDAYMQCSVDKPEIYLNLEVNVYFMFGFAFKLWYCTMICVSLFQLTCVFFIDCVRSVVYILGLFRNKFFLERRRAGVSNIPSDGEIPSRASAQGNSSVSAYSQPM
jgi:hypothetical protein